MLSTRFTSPHRLQASSSRSSVSFPVAALLIWRAVVWRSQMTVSGKVGWLIFTLVGMLLQCALLLFIIVSAITAAIGYAQ